jgi:exopolyphosphatase/pppGpp-phosphohydrolase
MLAQDAMAQALDDEPGMVVAVGGTATNLLKVTSGGTADRDLTPERIEEALDVLTTAPAAVLAEQFVLNPTRARVLPAGAVIVSALLSRYRVDRVVVADEGIREGAILVADHAGRDWRDRLPDLVHGWRA